MINASKINPEYLTAQMNLIFRARMLWRDMASWIRSYLISLIAGVGDINAVLQRLDKLPVEYGNILRLYFGDQTTDKYIALISEYILNFEALFNAQNNNDVDAINNMTTQLYKNADERAAFFASINPFWTESTWKSLLYAFTELNIAQAMTFLTKDYVKNIEIYDRILALSSIIGDYFSEGLTNYFTYSQSKKEK